MSSMETTSEFSELGISAGGDSHGVPYADEIEGEVIQVIMPRTIELPDLLNQGGGFWPPRPINTTQGYANRTRDRPLLQLPTD